MMFKKILAVLSTAAVFATATVAAHAAPVVFSVSNVSVSFGTPLDGETNATTVPSGATLTNLSADLSPAKTVDLFILRGANGTENDAESFSITAAVTVTGSLIGSVTYTFLGTISNWTNNGLNPTSGVLQWTSTAISTADPLLNLSLSNLFFTRQQNGGIPVALSYQALQSPAVVPLPAGVLLLGTALLGLFGLSRRRKLAAA